MTYFFETYGCQMNHAESASMEQILLARNWQPAESAETCGLLIINTCSVRITAETRVLGRLGYFTALKKKRRFFVMLIGCMAERLYNEIQQEYPLIDYVVGMFERNLLPAIFDEIQSRLLDASFMPEFASRSLYDKPTSGYYFAPFSYKQGAFQSFVPIMNGCNNFCTYCIVPYVRGREVSRNPHEVINEIGLLSEKKVREITLLGQNVNSYKGYDPILDRTVDFPSLIKAAAEKADEGNSIKWIRFLSSHPKDMSVKFMELIAEEKKICRLVHLPVQHGSNAILKKMNRVYTKEHYINSIKKLRELVSDVALSTDILIGFPGETEDDVKQTLDLMEEIEFDSAFMYHYNPREGTKAFSFPNRIPDEVKIERLQRIIDLQLKITAKKMRKKIGSSLLVLVESVSRNNPNELFGHTECGEMCVIEGALSKELIGNFVLVKINSLKGKTFRAELV